MQFHVYNFQELIKIYGNFDPKQQTMKYILLAVLIAATVAQTECKMGAFLLDTYEYTASQVKCLLNSGYSKIGAIIQSNSNGLNDADIKLVKLASQAGSVGTEIILVVCRNRDAQKFSAEFVSKIPQNLYGNVWLFGTEDQSDTTCDWSSPATWPTNGDRLLTIAQALKSAGVSGSAVSILGNITLWKYFFADTLKLKDYKLFWVPNEDETNHQPNFNDFTPFGGWTQPSAKILDIGSACGVQFGKYYFE